jgi:acetyl esterase/lipase
VSLSRRGLLAASALSGLLAGCGARSDPGDAATSTTPPTLRPPAPTRIRYGTAAESQFAELGMPPGSPLGTVVLIHGGYWHPQYGLELMRPLARALNRLGYASWNIEYRRIGAGGGVPTTLEDVAAAIDRLEGDGLPPRLTTGVALLGHSAGGHLAAWAASRTDDTPGGAPRVPVRGAISLAGVLDLTRAASSARSGGPVTAFLGGTPGEAPERYAMADPALLVPAPCPVWATYAEDDTVVPPEQSLRYVELARAAGGEAEVVRVPGDHFTLIDPGAESFATIKGLLTEAVT